MFKPEPEAPLKIFRQAVTSMLISREKDGLEIEIF